MKVYLISDTHFGHKNILAYCNRPFGTVGEMDKYMIKQWNDTVNDEDIVIHLGDFAFGSSEQIVEYANQLNGRKVLVKGNHDRKTTSFYQEKCKFIIAPHGTYLYNKYHNFIISHKPILDADIPEGYINLHGHIHNTNLSHNFSKDKHICLSVECLNDYKPVLLEDIIMS